MAETANPAVIIGLGGSGQWVLTYIKKNLMDMYDGKVPDSVRLLSFDTIDKSTKAKSEDEKEDFVHVGDVTLSDSEYQYIGGNIEQLCREIRDRNKHPHIGSWLQARYYLAANAPGAFDISKGAGQQRPFGRMSIFYDLQKSVENEIANRIQKAITDVVAANKKQAAVEIYIVASLAGGTGAGMFIDIAHLARWFAKRSINSGNFYVRGFLAMHNVFNSVIRVDQVKANAFAAMRELDRFMLVFDRQYPIVYNESNPILKTTYGGQLGKLFDTCYLLDANRENLPLDGVKPQYGVYPSIADGITMMLDTKAGDAYAQHHLNVNSRIAEQQALKQQPFYSSLGTYSMILPVEDMLESMAYRFSLELVGQHLTNAQALGNDQAVINFSGDPKKEVGDFLRMTQNKKGLQSTNFIQRVPNTLENRNTNDELYRKEIAELDANELQTWLAPPEGDPLVDQAAHEVNDTLQTRLITKVAPSHEYGDDTVTGADRITRGVREFKDEYLGRDVGGIRQGGRYRLGLERYVQIHRDRYRQLLSDYMLDLLNGVDPQNPLYQEQRRGKLGYVQEFLRILSNYFTDLGAFFGEVKRFREKQDYLRELQERANLDRAEMEDHKTDKGFLGIMMKGMGKAAKTQHTYLESEQSLIDELVIDLLFDHLRAAADSLRAVTEEFKSNVDAWVATLVQGITGSFSDDGVYRTLIKQQHRHENNREEKTNIKVHEYVTNSKYEDELYQSYTKGKFDEAMARMTWSVDTKSPTFKLDLSAAQLLGSDTASARTSTERNVNAIMNIARDYVNGVRQLTIAKRLSDDIGAAKLGSTLLQRCSPMIRYDPAKQGAQEAYNFIFINNGNQDGFYRELDSDLATRGASARSNQLLELTNCYTCTILATMDVLSSWGLSPYMDTAKSYDQHVGDSRLLHIFPAEVNAVEYEQRLPDIHEERRRFSSTLTTMMEDKKIVEDFILAYIYGLIRLEAVHRENRYILRLAPVAKRRDIDTFNLTLPSAKASLFEAMETFVFRKSDIDEQRPKRIDLERVRANIHDFEARTAKNDPQTLINILDDAINGQIYELRSNTDQSLKDLGSLMYLVVEDIIHTMEDLAKRGVKMNSTPIEPSLFSGELLEPEPEPVVVEVSEPVRPSREVARAVVPPAEPVAPSSNGTKEAIKSRLVELKELLADELISQEEYDEARKELMDQLKRV